MNRFSKFIIITATTVALAAPARAGDDAARVLAGLIGVAILGAALSELADDNRHVRVQPAPPVVPPARGRHGYGVQPRPLPDPVQRYALPRQCVRGPGNAPGGNALLARGCLKRNFVDANALPRECAVKYWNQRRSDVRNGFTLRCLQRYGYRMARN